MLENKLAIIIYTLKNSDNTCDITKIVKDMTVSDGPYGSSDFYFDDEIVSPRFDDNNALGFPIRPVKN